jgi:hypothetical protein
MRTKLKKTNVRKRKHCHADAELYVHLHAPLPRNRKRVGKNKREDVGKGDVVIPTSTPGFDQPLKMP